MFDFKFLNFNDFSNEGTLVKHVNKGRNDT